MSSHFKFPALAWAGMLAAALIGTTTAAATNDPAGTVEVSVGAEYVSPPVQPETFFVDARMLPPLRAWQPGDVLREIPRQFHGEAERQRNPPPAVNAVLGSDILAALQREVGDGVLDRAFQTPLVNRDGQGFTGVYPPDVSGDVGGGYYMQAINSSGGAVYTVYNTSNGSVAAGPFSMSTLGSGGQCATGLGDGVVVYDQIANRWVLTEFSNAGNNLCIYLSAGSSPVSTTWTRYAFTAPGFPDYPKWGVWPDAYYAGTNESSPALYAFDRTKMLAGQAATMQRKTVTKLSGLGFQMVQPASFNGTTPPPAGAPGIFVRQNDDERNNVGSNNPNEDYLEMFAYKVDWTTPANTTLTGPVRIAESEFDSKFTVSGFGAIAQPGTTRTLDPLLEVVMMPYHYRNFGTYESLVGNHVVRLNTTSNQAGIRWWEMRRTGGIANPWTLYQEGTYAPADSGGQISRWMGSIAMDASGNIALGYSVARSSPAVYPGLRYVGRLASDPLGVMTMSETSLIEGSASQTNYDRWGDYHHMSIDPTDGCTFWFSGEYRGASNWATRIGSMRFDACGASTFTLAGTNLSQQVCAASPTPIALAPVTLSLGSVSGFNSPVTLSFAGGLPPGFSGGFSATPVTPPGSSTASLAVDNGATPGANLVTLRGSSGGTDIDVPLTVDVATAPPGRPVTVAPADGAVDVSTQPIFNWTAGAQAGSYLIQIATDPGFANIILAQTVSGTSFQPSAALPSATTIYWRVIASNTCGGSGDAPTATFTTLAAPGQCSASSTAVTVFSDDVENGSNGWTHSAATGTDSWAITTTRPNSPTHSWQASGPASLADQGLVSPVIALPAHLNGLNLQFDHWRNIEANTGATTCYDGAILEIALDGGAFAAVPSSKLIGDPYNGAVSTGYNNPIGGSQAWCGSKPYTHVIADVSEYAGRSAQFRFRFASDSSTASTGWNVDDVLVKGCAPSGSDLIFADGFDPLP